MIFKKIGKDKIAKNSESAEEKAAAENVAETESPEEDEQLQEEIDELIRKRATDPIQDELQIKELRQELRRVKYNNSFRAALFNTVGTLMVVAAAAILIAYLWLPILQVTGTSMAPTLSEGELLVASKLDTYETGDLIAFYYNNKILVKRVIATSGDWVDISEDGTVYVNNIALEEPYLTDKALGNCNIELPYQVPETKIFVMGDHRSVSLDSRNTTIGCVSEEQIVGRVFYRVWPLKDFGKID